MGNHEGGDLLKRVERYETALQELRTAQEAVKDVLRESLLTERWRQLGEGLGVTGEAQQPKPVANPPQRETNGHAELVEQLSEMPNWAG